MQSMNYDFNIIGIDGPSIITVHIRTHTCAPVIVVIGYELVMVAVP